MESKYYRIPKKKEPLEENEIFITNRQNPISFLKYSIFLFEKRNLPYIKLKASGSAIAVLINIAELLKKIIPDISQINKIYTLKYEQEYEPKEKGLDHVKIVRNVPILEIGFYKVLPTIEVNKIYGYQPALSKEVFNRVKLNIDHYYNSNPNWKNKNHPTFRVFRGYRGYRAGFRGMFKLRQRSRGLRYQFDFFNNINSNNYEK